MLIIAIKLVMLIGGCAGIVNFVIECINCQDIVAQRPAAHPDYIKYLRKKSGWSGIWAIGCFIIVLIGGFL